MVWQPSVGGSHNHLERQTRVCCPTPDFLHISDIDPFEPNMATSLLTSFLAISLFLGCMAASSKHSAIPGAMCVPVRGGEGGAELQFTTAETLGAVEDVESKRQCGDFIYKAFTCASVKPFCHMHKARFETKKECNTLAQSFSSSKREASCSKSDDKFLLRFGSVKHCLTFAKRLYKCDSQDSKAPKARKRNRKNKSTSN